MNQSSDEEGKAENQVNNAKTIDVIALPLPPVDHLSDSENIDDEKLDGEIPVPNQIAGEVELQDIQDEEKEATRGMGVTHEPMDITYEEVEVPIYDANQPSTSSFDTFWIFCKWYCV